MFRISAFYHHFAPRMSDLPRFWMFWISLVPSLFISNRGIHAPSFLHLPSLYQTLSTEKNPVKIVCKTLSKSLPFWHAWRSAIEHCRHDRTSQKVNKNWKGFRCKYVAWESIFCEKVFKLLLFFYLTVLFNLHF